jgi:hypothetical protein
MSPPTDGIRASSSAPLRYVRPTCASAWVAVELRNTRRRAGGCGVADALLCKASEPQRVPSWQESAEDERQRQKPAGLWILTSVRSASRSRNQARHGRRTGTRLIRRCGWHATYQRCMRLVCRFLGNPEAKRTAARVGGFGQSQRAPLAEPMSESKETQCRWNVTVRPPSKAKRSDADRSRGQPKRPDLSARASRRSLICSAHPALQRLLTSEDWLHRTAPLRVREATAPHGIVYRRHTALRCRPWHAPSRAAGVSRRFGQRHFGHVSHPFSLLATWRA